jgi:hypothetical protein
VLTDHQEKDSVWQKTPYVNLLRYKPSQVYFARFRVKGKLIRRSLKTNSITVAKMRLDGLREVGKDLTLKTDELMLCWNEVLGCSLVRDCQLLQQPKKQISRRGARW